MLEYVAENPVWEISRKYFDGSLAYAAIDTEWEEMLKQIRFIWCGRA